MILILTPLKKELDHLRQALSDLDYKFSPGPSEQLACDKELGGKMILAHGGLGKTQFAVQATYWRSQCPQTKLMICVGGAAALRDEISIADVVIAERIIEYEFEGQPRFNTDEMAVRQLRSLPAMPLGLHFGSVLSGDANILDSDRAKELCVKYDALAAAWEGAGLARAARTFRTPFLEIRGITDRADQRSRHDFFTNLKDAMKSAAVVIDILSKEIKSV